MCLNHLGLWHTEWFLFPLSLGFGTHLFCLSSLLLKFFVSLMYHVTASGLGQGVGRRAGCPGRSSLLYEWGTSELILNHKGILTSG